LQNPEFTDIDASIQALVRRAYDLGRSDALKKVVEVLNTESISSERLALMGPIPGAEEPPPEHQTAANDPRPSLTSSEPAPWWAWKVR
jgi:hypothetical protein